MLWKLRLTYFNLHVILWWMKSSIYIQLISYIRGRERERSEQLLLRKFKQLHFQSNQNQTHWVLCYWWFIDKFKLLPRIFPFLSPFTVNWHKISFLSNFYLPVTTWASSLIITLGGCDVSFWARKVELQAAWNTGIEIFETCCTL